MANRIRVGLVGASVNAGGGWAPRAHIPALQALPDYEITAVCTTNAASAEASAKAFGARLAFHDVAEMAAHAEVDLVVVSLKVPNHYAPVMAALEVGKDTFCEWPLGANLAEAEEMTAKSHAKGVQTIVGLQARSDPALMFAREMIQKGEIGDVLSASVTMFGGAPAERGPERAWSAKRSAGANTLTIIGGHHIDALCALIGELTEVGARVTTKSPHWRLTDGTTVDVDAPDSVSFIATTAGGAEVSGHVFGLPSGRGEVRLTVWGSEGSIALATPQGTANIGPNSVFVGKGGGQPEERDIPGKFKLVPEGTPEGAPYNVAQAYARFADAKSEGVDFEVDFGAALTRHRMLDAMERSTAEGKAIALA